MCCDTPQHTILYCPYYWCPVAKNIIQRPTSWPKLARPSGRRRDIMKMNIAEEHHRQHHSVHRRVVLQCIMQIWAGDTIHKRCCMICSTQWPGHQYWGRQIFIIKLQESRQLSKFKCLLKCFKATIMMVGEGRCVSLTKLLVRRPQDCSMRVIQDKLYPGVADHPHHTISYDTLW